MVRATKAHGSFIPSAPQRAAQKSRVRFGGAAAFLVALSNITVSPVPRGEEVDTISQEIQKPLLTDDILGSAPLNT